MLNYRNLVIWQKAHALTLFIYQLTSTFPNEERYGLTTQMRRAAVSIPSNIAEGSGRSSKPDLRRFLIIAIGSASELEYQLILSKDLMFISDYECETTTAKTTELRKMLYAYANKLK